jgi:hypothetical protein
MMRHFFSFALLIAIGLVSGLAPGLICRAHATPVYLRVDSRFPSGERPRKWLEAKTSKVQNQLWVRVQTPDGTVGWLPEDHLVTPLKLATEAVLTSDARTRSESANDAIKQPRLERGTRVLILEVADGWARTQPLPATENGVAWLPANQLKPSLTAQTKKVFIPKSTTVYVMPAPPKSARKLGALREGSFVQTLKIAPEWIEIAFGGAHGYIRRTDAVTLDDLIDTTEILHALPLLTPLPLRSSPLPFSNVAKTLTGGVKLKIIGESPLRWGQARLADLGEVWWPMSDDGDDESRLTATRLPTRELFSRKIFDMAANPSVPNEKYISAQGIFHSNDGEQWTRIPFFKEENHPIAIARNGSLFVGAFESRDKGRTFQSWIRWDSLIATLKNRYRTTPQGLKIIEIRPENSSGKEITLRLDIGLAKPVRVFTADQGNSWQAL